MASSFHYMNNILWCEQLDLNEFARSHPTPFYIYSRRELVTNCTKILALKNEFDFLPCYALKANYNPQLLKIICDLGFGADVVSGGELIFALKAGFPADKIVFAGVGKTEEEIELAIRSRIHSFNVESAGELQLIGKIAEKFSTKTGVAIRLNPDIDANTHKYIATGLHANKFGLAPDEALRLYKQARDNPWLLPAGVHVHIGSQITDAGPYAKTAAFLKNFAQRLCKEGVTVSYLDLGGGIGINYDQSFEDPSQPSTFIEQILPAYLEEFRNTSWRLIAELGRSIIGSAGLLVSKVLYNKTTPQKNFLIVDAAMNNLIRPSLYNAHHQIVPLKKSNAPKIVCDVVGPVCESGDFLAKERLMQKCDSGDYLAVGAAGAYGQALASNYNLRPRITEYLVDGNQVQTIYQAQTIEDIANQFRW